MKKITEMTSSELFNEMTDTQKDDVYRKVWAGHVHKDVMELLEKEENKEEIAESITNAYVYDGKYDCNLSYWDNLHNLIERFSE